MYALTAPSLDSGTVLLNGRQLAVGRDDRIPPFRPQRLQGSRVMVAPASIAFIAMPHARNPGCK
jgi:hypothetical protein